MVRLLTTVGPTPPPLPAAPSQTPHAPPLNCWLQLVRSLPPPNSSTIDASAFAIPFRCRLGLLPSSCTAIVSAPRYWLPSSNDLVLFFCQLQLISAINWLAAAASSHSSCLHFSTCCSPANNCNLLALTFRNILIAAAAWHYLWF
ncbi:hypothetical protein PVAP13_6KG158700 [Panicum virgatum]|uniref:Uncharacterized protein n=1 Tax=Panicum virgatum TaxID=38727 RepID=A0A8T0RC81_PANVG|nr:hypothetical protein PVAP13_6KG158700 [Panicum virgatum]